MSMQKPQIITLLDGTQVELQPMTMRDKIWSFSVTMVVLGFAIWALASCVAANKYEKNVPVEFQYKVQILKQVSWVMGPEWDTYWTNNPPRCTQNAFGTYDCESIGGINYNMWNQINPDFAVTGAVITWVKDPKEVWLRESIAKTVSESEIR